MSKQQSALFVSHGTIYEAFKSTDVTAMFRSLRERAVPEKPDAIVVVSGHWITREMRISSCERLLQADDGFPMEFRTTYSPKGHPLLAKNIAERLVKAGVAASLEENAELDHGALIPLMTMFPEADVPVVQISLHHSLDPIYHANIARILVPLLSENILFLGSGGLVHNRHEIVRFGGSNLSPDEWASAFEELVVATLVSAVPSSNFTNALAELYHHPTFLQAHPTSEHFLPLVFMSAMGKQVERMNTGFQWKNLSMGAFRFWGR
jgi:4,5-DOPA dioxygenase extradiol